jgi:hypothetical protein
METALQQFLDSLPKKLRDWEVGDQRLVMLFVCPHKEGFQLRASWDDTKVEFCISDLSQYRVLVSNSQDSLISILKGLKTIVRETGHGDVSVTPRRKAEVYKGFIDFKVVWTVIDYTKTNIAA